MAEASKLMEYVVILAIFIIIVAIFFIPKAAFAKSREAFSDTLGWGKRLLPTIGVGTEEIPASGVLVPVEDAQQLGAFRRAIEAMKASPKSECVFNVQEFSNLEKSAWLIQYDSLNDITYFVVTGGAGGTQELSRFNVPGMRPCVIAGDAVVERFQNRYFESKGGIIAYTSANSIRISSEGITFDGNDGGTLRGREWLYKPDAQHFCFFPSTDGIDSDYFNVASTYFETGVLPPCS